MTLANFQFELLPYDGATSGQVFGIGAEVSLNSDGFHPGSTDWADQDSASSSDGHTNFGRDTLLGPSWSWDLHVNRDDCADALASLGSFTTAWKALHIRDTPGLVLPLRYRLIGRTRRIYGRPRRCEASPTNLILNGYADIGVDFKAVDGFIYDDEETTASIDIGGGSSDTGGGWVFPVTFPYSSFASTDQERTIIVDGEAPTHPVIRIDGPISTPVLEVGDWSLTLNYDIPAGNYVEIDTRPWAMTVLLNGETSVAGALSLRTSLPNLVLNPGPLFVRFHGVSSTGAATATLRWRSAWNSL